jgi:endoglucanase
MQADSYASDGLWYNSNYPEATVISGWTTLLKRYADQWNVIAADLKNEPFSATWGTGADTDWNKGAARMANSIASSVSSRFLIFVEGTASSPSCSDACFYGEDLVVRTILPSHVISVRILR